MPDTRTNGELSAEVARRLFGLVPCQNDSHKPGGWAEGVACYAQPFLLYRGDDLIPYASDRGVMWLVVDEMRERGYLFSIDDFCGDGNTSAVMFIAKESNAKGEAICKYGQEPRSICEAALAALDSKGK